MLARLAQPRSVASAPPGLYAVYGLGERGPRMSFEDPDLAHLAAGALALAERPARFRFQEDAKGGST